MSENYDVISIKTGAKIIESCISKFLAFDTSPFSLKTVIYIARGKKKVFPNFLYREDEAKLVDTYQYEDNQVGDEDAFSREPFILRFSCKHTGDTSISASTLD